MSTTNNDFGFPPIDNALTDPNGLLAMGGDLSIERLNHAYANGIFPWYEEDQPILWWTPDPRCIVYPNKISASRSLKKAMRKDNFALSSDNAFEAVIHACAEDRQASEGTWINTDMIDAYTRLFENGDAHSIEVWDENELIGGLYGVANQGIFSGESMFHRRDNCSKIAFIALCQHLKDLAWPLLDCQINNPHLQSLGAEEISRNDYYLLLERVTKTKAERWKPLPWSTTNELLGSLR